MKRLVMEHQLLIHVSRKERFHKIYVINEKGLPIYFRDESDLLDLRESETINQYRGTYHTRWSDIWSYLKGYRVLHRWADESYWPTYLPDWLLLQPKFIHPDKREFIYKELNAIVVEFKIQEYQLEQIEAWRNACHK